MVGKLTRDDRASASMLPSIMGINKYASPNDALTAAINAIQGREREDIGNEAMAWGNTFEPAILKEAALRLGLDNLDISHDQPYNHQDLPLSCSLDGTAIGRGQRITTNPDAGIFVMGQDEIILDGLGIMEAKLTASDAEDSPPLWRGPVQAQAQMDIMGAKWGAVCTLYRGTKLRVYLFAPHEATLAAIRQAVTDFERRLQLYRDTGAIDYYPPADSEDANRTWPLANEESEPLWLPAADEELALKILNEKQVIKTAEKNISNWEKELKTRMKDAAMAYAGEYEIRWPMRHYQAKPAYIVPAKEASVARQSTLTIKKRKP